MSSSKVRIFDNEAVELLGVLFKRNKSVEVFAKLCELSHNLIQSILRSEGYPNTDDVYNYLYLQIERWVDKWVPGKGHFYAYLSASTKNAAVSYSAKETLYRQKIIGTDVPLEDLASGDEYHYYDQAFRTSELDKLKEELGSIEVRWPEPEIRDALQYVFVTILEGRCRSVPDRGRIIKYLQMVEVKRSDGTSFMLNAKQAKVLLAYAQGAVRISFLNTRIGGQILTDSDIMKLRYEFQPFSDMEDIVGPEGARRMFTHFAGQTIKFPSLKICGEIRRQVTSFVMAASESLEEREFVVGAGNSLEYLHDEDGGVGFEDLHRVHHEAMGIRREMLASKVGTFKLFDQDSIGVIEDTFEDYGEGE